MNDELMYKINDALRELLYEGAHHAIYGLGFVFSHFPDGYKNKEKLIELKTNSMKRLHDNYELGLIKDKEAKKELMRILHGPQSLNKESQE